MLKNKRRTRKRIKRIRSTVIITSEPEKFLNDTFDYVVKNPGITYEHKCILKADELEIPVVNEMEVAYNLLPKDVKIIGITGSNGKTTTATLTYELIKETNNKVHLGEILVYPFVQCLIR